MDMIFMLSAVVISFVCGLATGLGFSSSLIIDHDPKNRYLDKEQSPNRRFIERYGDRRLPNQAWGEQVSRAYGVMPTNKPVVIKNPKSEKAAHAAMEQSYRLLGKGKS